MIEQLKTIKFKTIEEALKACKHGAYGGFVFAAMYFVGLLFVAFANFNAGTGNMVGGDDIQKVANIVIFLLIIFLILFLSYRVKIGKGIISSVVLIAFFAFEIIGKIVSGTASPVWYVFYIIVFVAMLQGLKGCWNVRRINKNYSAE